MNVLLITIDSLRRDFLGAYADRPRGFGYEVETDNLDRFAERAAVFDTHYAGSLPCMPARREFLAGVQEFFWRPWGPMEPFDEPVPRLAKSVGVPAQLITDHYHYFEYGGEGYYEDYTGFEFVRGHEHDSWRTTPKQPDRRLLNQIRVDNPLAVDRHDVMYARNVAEFDETDEADFFAPKVFSRTAEWLGENSEWEQWFCYVDSFDVHEPFHCPEPYASMYTDENPRDSDLIVWPEYAAIDEQGLTDRQLEFVRSQFAGKVTMVDRHFGHVLDRLDREDLWDETIVIVTTDHGYMLGEHGHVAKNYMPVYEEIAHTPLMVWYPDAARTVERVESVTSAVDIYATLLDGLGVETPETTHSRSLLPVLRGADEHRECAVFGYFGAGVSVTDGRYVYMHPPRSDTTVGCYSTMQMPRSRDVAPRPNAEAGDFLPYTDVPTWRYEEDTWLQHEEPLLFDTRTDPGQEENLVEKRPTEVERLRGLLREEMERLQVPAEQFERLGLA